MENIIKGILDIDKQAKQKIANAEVERNQIIAEAKAKEAMIMEEKIKEADKKLADIEAEEKQKADIKLAEIESERELEIKRLGKVFEERRVKWQDEIFNAIVNG